MLNNNKTLSLLICVTSLSACTSMGPNPYMTNQPYVYDGSQLYPEGYESIDYSSMGEKTQVVVPESYHVSAEHAPTPHQDIDRHWVNEQNSQNYTIELADGDKASQVANTLYKAPKNEHMAELKYSRNGKTYYKGLYGSYPTHEAAEQALSALPADIKQSAGIKTWNSVQSSARE